MGLGIIAEAVIRIEHKLDVVIRALQFLNPKEQIPQVHFVGTTCPVCNQIIDYQVDLTNNVAVRRCGCKSGKVPSSIPLFPVTGAPNGNPTAPETGTDPAADGRQEGRRRKSR